MAGSSRNGSPIMEEEDDVVEIKKAMATGSVNRDNTTAMSSGIAECDCSPSALAHASGSSADCMLLPCLYPHDGREQGE